MTNYVVRILLIISVFLSPLSHADMFIYQMKFQPAANVVDAIKPHIAPETIISAKNNQLFIQGSAAEYAKIESMLVILDKKLAEYFVEVKVMNRKLDQSEMQSHQISISNEQIKGKISRYQTSDNQDSEKIFSLRLIEGYPGFINTGEEFVTNELVGRYDGFVPAGSIRKITSGFYVTLRTLDSEKLNVTISTESGRRQPANKDTIESTSTNSSVIASQDQWFLLASINVEESQSTNRQYSTQNTRNNKRWYYLRIRSINNP